MILFFAAVAIFAAGFMVGFGIATFIAKPRKQFRTTPPEGVHGVYEILHETAEQWN